MVTGLLAWLFETGEIDGAVVTRFRHEEPLEPEAFIARSIAEVLTSRSSKYSPVSLAGILRTIERTSGRYAVVGLPCHLHAVRRLEELRPGLVRKIVWHFGLYCSSSKSFAATEYLLGALGAKPSTVTSFAYRDNGCLGSMIVQLKDGTEIRWLYRDYYPLLRSFFIPHRCTLCPDQCAELADISFGDLYIREFWGDKSGTSSIIARSRRAVALLETARDGGAIELVPLERALLVKSQALMLSRKKSELPVRLSLMHLLGRPAPRYDVCGPTRNVWRILHGLWGALALYGQIAVGEHRRWWHIIDLVNRLSKRTAGGRRSVVIVGSEGTGGARQRANE